MGQYHIETLSHAVISCPCLLNIRKQTLGMFGLISNAPQQTNPAHSILWGHLYRSSTCESHCYFLASTQNSDIFPSNRAEVQVKLQSGAKLSSSHFFENKHELYKKYKGTYYSSICRVTPTVVVMGFLCNWGTKWIWHSGFGTTRTSGENRQEMVRRCSLILWWGVTGKSQHISLEYTFNQKEWYLQERFCFYNISIPKHQNFCTDD